MYRNELNYSDDQLRDFLYQGYDIKAKRLTFIDVGSFYAFIVTTTNNDKFFLKIYPKDQSLVPIQPTIESLNNVGKTLQRFRNEFGINNLSFCIPDCSGRYCFETSELILILFEHIEGIHPSYIPNQLSANKLANVFYQLHQIPIDEFPYFEKEKYDIQYALGLSAWIKHTIIPKDITHAEHLCDQLNTHQQKLINGLDKLQQWQIKFSSENLPYVITHGDAHHYNVLQTPVEVWLVDWDGLKLAPIERDLWHYEHAPLINEYCKLNPQYVINHELCSFYQLQRFFEDLRFYLDQVLLSKNTTTAQSKLDVQNFMNHWGWSVSLNKL